MAEENKNSYSGELLTAANHCKTLFNHTIATANFQLLPYQYHLGKTIFCHLIIIKQISTNYTTGYEWKI